MWLVVTLGPVYHPVGMSKHWNPLQIEALPFSLKCLYL